MKKSRNWLKSPLTKLILATGLLLTLSSTLFYCIEFEGEGNRSMFEALWWSVVTISTVGYGDIVPMSIPGRLLGLLVMLSGIGLVSTLTGNLASLLVERHTKKRKGLLKVKLSGHVIIVGWNTHGYNLVKTLQDHREEGTSGLVLVNTLLPEQRDELAHKIDMDVQFVAGTCANEAVATRAAPDKARVIFILCPENLDPAEADQQNIYAALTMRSLAPKVPIYAEVMLSENREYLLRTGVDEVIARGELAGKLLGLMGSTPAFYHFFQRLTGSADTGMLGCRPLRHHEKQMNWGTFLANVRREEGILPMALFQVSKHMSLQDILDQESALDHFILELFSSTGQSTNLGKQNPRMCVNPKDEQSLAGFDAIMFLQAGGTA
ncbi:potassium channel family protein [Desulfoplanes sp. PS50]